MHRRKPPVLAGCRCSRWEYCVCDLINTNLQSWDKNLKKRFNEMSVGQVGRVMDGGEIPSAVLEVNTNAVWPDQKAGLLLSLCSSLLPCSSSFRPSPAPHSPPQSFFSYPALCFICFCCSVLFSVPHTRHNSPSSILVLVTSLVPPALFSSLWIPPVLPFNLMGEEWSTPIQWAFLPACEERTFSGPAISKQPINHRSLALLGEMVSQSWTINTAEPHSSLPPPPHPIFLFTSVVHKLHTNFTDFPVLSTVSNYTFIDLMLKQCEIVWQKKPNIREFQLLTEYWLFYSDLDTVQVWEDMQSTTRRECSTLPMITLWLVIEVLHTICSKSIQDLVQPVKVFLICFGSFVEGVFSELLRSSSVTSISWGSKGSDSSETFHSCFTI